MAPVTTSPKKTPAWLLALGREEPPAEVDLESGRYRLKKIFKHDFFAFTARYDRTQPDQEFDVVLKVGRKAWMFFVPLGWIGRLHAWHESRVLQRVDDLEVVPAFTGRWGKHGFSHAFVPGDELKKGSPVPDDFFARLQVGLNEIHARGMAYVDLEKPENVLVGEDGAPYLFDFQIAFYWPRKAGGYLPPLTWIRTWTQRSDQYHLMKLRRRVRPDQMSEEELLSSRTRPLYVRVHNRVTRPFTHLRRRFLERVDPKKKITEERGRHE
ncbi:MAG: hypothetical protein ACI82F_001119 [Planctomycetota bacterium]|jgi:hypothetical protein